MWLLPAFSAIGRLATRTYYRLHVEGFTPPKDGPVLLVANHPNSLLDPALVAAAARRPVRFLAKAPLFKEPVIGLLVRAMGSIPVYRRQDDPALMERNTDAFDAAYAALRSGSAVGIFPEGISHDRPSIAPLRTGAARIALGTSTLMDGSFPIVPVGLVFRDKEVFRSEAIVAVGEPIRWDDLVPLGATPEAVRELTERIDRALREVTLNLESWEDMPLVESAYAIFAAEFEINESATDQLSRLRTGIRRLAELRRSGGDRWRRVAREILQHRRLLARAGLTPADLRADSSLSRAVWRAGRLIPFLTALALAGGAIGTVLFWPPYRFVAFAEKTLKPDPTVRSTTKLLAGLVSFSVYIILIALGAGFLFGAATGVLTVVMLPFVAMITLGFHERWRTGRIEARRLIFKRTRAGRIAELRARQRLIAESIDELVMGPPTAVS